MALTLTSRNFDEGDYIAQEHVLSEPYGFGCAGGNVSPQLSWSGAPEGTKSFVVTCYDPDAPTGSGFWHWLVVNIPPDVMSLDLGAGGGNSIPEGALETRTDFGTAGYGGPCPPKGDDAHRYIFTVFAVGGELSATDDIPPAQIGFQLNFNTLEKATLMGLYKH